MDASKRFWGMPACGKPLAFFCAIALCAMPAAGAVLDSRGESFEALSGNAAYVRSNHDGLQNASVSPQMGETSIDSALGATATVARRPHDSDSGEFETFELADGDHHSRDGGGWVEHGGLGDDRGGEGMECGPGCVTPSAVPEPGRFVLTLAGLLAVVFFVKRRARIGSRLASTR